MIDGALLRLALEAAEEGIIVTDAEGRVVLWSRGAERMFGWRADEARGRPLRGLHLRELPPQEFARLEAELRAGRSVCLDGPRRRRDGGRLQVESRITPLIDADGRFQGAFGMVRDITPLAASQRALAKSEEKFARAFRHFPELAMISRLRDGLLVEVSHSFERVFGVRAAEVVGGKTTTELGIWRDAAERERLVAALRARGEVTDHPAVFVDGQGRPREVLISAGIIELEGEAHIIGTARDVTELKRSEEALRLSEEKFAKAFHASTDGIAIVREDGLILDVNEAFERLTGYAREEVLGRTTLDLGLWAQPEKRADYLRRLRAHGRVEDYAFALCCRSGEVRDIRMSSVALAIGGVPCMIAILHDVTAQRRAEEEIRRLNVTLEERVRRRTAELEQAVREMESFSYSISHDLRAPLRAIAGYARILEEDYGSRLDEEGRRLLGRIAASAVRMGELIDDLLDFSRVGRAELKRTVVDMNGLVRDVLAEMPEVIGGRQRIEIGMLPPASADRVLLRQVWANLLSNAIKYSRPRQKALIEIGGAREEGGVHYWVRDNGVGFDPAYADKLFRVFQRLHRDTAFEGTGVGLAIVARIVERHGGRVWAEGAPEAGACFHFTLPAPCAAN